MTGDQALEELAKNRGCSQANEESKKHSLVKKEHLHERVYHSDNEPF
jgi:hypothetical protein